MNLARRIAAQVLTKDQLGQELAEALTQENARLKMLKAEYEANAAKLRKDLRDRDVNFSRVFNQLQTERACTESLQEKYDLLKEDFERMAWVER